MYVRKYEYSMYIDLLFFFYFTFKFVYILFLFLLFSLLCYTPDGHRKYWSKNPLKKSFLRTHAFTKTTLTHTFLYTLLHANIHLYIHNIHLYACMDISFLNLRSY